MLEQAIASLQVTAVSAVGYGCSSRWRVAERVVADSMWYWVESGSGQGWVENPEQQFAFGAGDLVLMPRGEAQSTWALPGQKIKLVSVHFYADVFGGLDACALFGLRGCIHLPKVSLAGKAIWELARLHALRPAGADESMKALVTSIMIELLRWRASQASLGGDDARWRALTRLQPVLRLMDEKLHEPGLSAADLARRAHLSEVALRRLFRLAGLASPTNELRRKRVERAHALLRTTARPLKEIASLCGFASTTFFHRVFKSCAGTTPLGCRTGEAF